MTALVKAEMRRVLGRKPSVIGSAIFVALSGMGVLLWVVLSDNPNGGDALDAGIGLLVATVAACSIVIGAMAGSYDVANGTMRYLVLTGVSRTRLALIRIPALAATIIVISLPGLALVSFATLIAPSPAPTGGQWFDLFYMVWLSGIVYGLLSLGIGMLLRSNGVAIATALIVNMVGATIAALIREYVSRTLGQSFFSEAAGIVIARDSDAALSLGVALVVLIAWLAALLGAATLRVHRAEY